MTRAMLVPCTMQFGGPCTLPLSTPPAAGAVKATLGAPLVGVGAGAGAATVFWIVIARVAFSVWPAALSATALRLYAPSRHSSVLIQQPRPLVRLPSVLVHTSLM